MSSPFLRNKNIIDVVKFRWLWIGISGLLIIPGIFAMLYLAVIQPDHSPLKLGIDFTGGAMLQYGFHKELNPSDISIIRDDLKNAGIENPVIQVTKAEDLYTGKSSGSSEEISKKSAAGIKSIVSIRTRFLSSEKSNNEVAKVNESLKKSFGEYTLLQVSAIGPTLGKELFKNALFALLLSFGAIVLYLSFRFKPDYGVFALIALFHDTLFVCGVFAILGILFGVEIDSLFITAILTVIGFSVHDTIVVFDRIRENSRFLAKKKTFNEVVNASVNQTLARSINTSLTVIITLLALYLLGGVTTRDFVFAMLIGVAIGTYSSIFSASTLLAMWRSRDTGKKRPAMA